MYARMQWLYTVVYSIGVGTLAYLYLGSPAVGHLSLGLCCLAGYAAVLPLSAWTTVPAMSARWPQAVPQADEPFPGFSEAERRSNRRRDIEPLVFAVFLPLFIMCMICYLIGHRATMADISVDGLGKPFSLPGSMAAVLRSLIDGQPSQPALDHRNHVAFASGIIALAAYVVFAIRAIRLPVRLACFGGIVLCLATFLVVVPSIIPYDTLKGGSCPALQAAFRDRSSMTEQETAAFAKLGCALPESFSRSVLVKPPQ